MSFLKGFTRIENLIEKGFQCKRHDTLVPSQEGCRAIASFEEHGQSFIGGGIYTSNQGTLYSTNQAYENVQLQDNAAYERHFKVLLDYAAAISQFEPVTFCVPPGIPRLYKTARQLLPDHIRVLEVDNRITNPLFGPRYVRAVRGYCKGVDCNTKTPNFVARKFFETDFRFCYDIKEKLDLSALCIDFNSERCALVYDKEGAHVYDRIKKEMVSAWLKQNFSIDRIVWCAEFCRFLDDKTVVFCLSGPPPKTKEESLLFCFPEEVDSNIKEKWKFVEVPRKYMGFSFTNSGLVIPAYGNALKDTTVLKIFTSNTNQRRVVQVHIPEDMEHIVDFYQCTLSQPKDRVDTTISHVSNSLMLFDTRISIYREFLRKKRLSRQKEQVTSESKTDISSSVSKYIEQVKLSETLRETTTREAPQEKPPSNNDKSHPTRNLSRHDERDSDPDTPIDDDVENKSQLQPQEEIQQVRTIDPDAPVEDAEQLPEENFKLQKKPPRRLKKKKVKGNK